MTIRTRVRLLSAVALLGILLFLGTGFLDQRERHRQQTAVAEQARSARHLLAVIHQLQKERGRSAAYLGEPSPENRAALLAQHADTARVLGAATAAGGGRQLQQEIASLRERILRRQIGAAQAHAFYAREIERLLAGLTHVRQSASSPDIRRNLAALVHFIHAKETLGQIRARLSLDLAAGRHEAAVGYEIARYDALLHYHLDEARRHAPESLAAALERLLALPPVEEMLATIARTAGPQQERLQMSQTAWFALATETIDLFRRTEEEAIGMFAAQADELLAETRRGMLVHLLTAATVAGMVLLLAALTLRLVLRPLDRLLASVREVVQSRDFTVRLPPGRDDEVGIVARAFNDLLQTVDRLIQEKDFLARTDLLTGAANRLAFAEALAHELARKRRYPGELSLLLFDLDHFKKVNDTFGHDVGDEVLRAVARLVKNSVREADIFARWGGEEFVILAPDSPAADAAHLAEKLRLRIEQHDFPGAGSLTASFGIAPFIAGDDAESLVKRADLALYRAKETGRNRVVVDTGDSSGFSVPQNG